MQSMMRFQSGLLYSSLPQVFQDAISLTKDLDIRFLWIDALCIIQDSNDDFDQECAQMSDIYSNSSCNFVAIFGQNPYASLFRTRNHDTLKIGKFQHGWKQLQIAPELWPDFDSIVPIRCLSREMLNSEIASRGWILQEILLAPRAVLFGTDQVHWMCRGLQACEIWPGGNPNTITTEMSSGLTERYSSFHMEDHAEYWSTIVNRYSTLTLSNASDKLPAIAGVAKLFMQRIGDEYFAGHWKSMLPYSLLWHIPANVYYDGGWMAKYGMLTSACGHPSAEYRAPSWSWASINGIVDFLIDSYGPNVVFLCRMLDVHVDTAGRDPTGRVVDGRITIRAPWAPADRLGDFELQSGVSPGFRKMMWDGASIADGMVELAAVAAEHFQEYRSTQEDQEETRTRIHGLILLPLQSQTGIYRRVGAFYVEVTLGPEAVLDAFSLKFSKESLGNVTADDEPCLRTFEIV